ncbi:MAG: peptidylprolyl isomerase [Spirochaetota bacterium]
MQIQRNKVVKIDYTLKDDDGNVIDTSEGREPLAYLQGHQNIIAGLEAALEGKTVGDAFDVKVAPEDGYGVYNEEMKQTLDKDKFSGVDKIEVGMQFKVQSQNGVQIVTVVDVKNSEVTIDANHPLAGRNLNFSVEVREIRDATSEELSHGQVNAPIPGGQ